MTDYSVYKRGDVWVGKGNGNSRVSATAPTQAAAYDATRGISARNGGGEISIHGLDGRIRDKNTIAPARDPRSSKG